MVELRRVTKLRTIKVKEYGYTDYSEIMSQLLCKQLFIFGIPTIWWTYFKERLPLWAFFQYRMLGATDWKSKRPNLIDYHKTRPIIWKI